MDIEKATKQEIVKSAEAVKRKVKMMRDMTSEKEKMLESVLKPITDPLNQIASQSKISAPIKNKTINPSGYSTPKKYKFDSNDVKSGLFNDDTIRELSDETIKDGSLALNEDYTFDSCEKSGTENEEDKSASSDDETYESGTSFDRNYSSPLSFSVKTFQDIPYGVRVERGKLMMGSQRVFVAENTITINSTPYKKTSGLVQLLFKKIPKFELVTAEDKENYKLILNQTNAHRRDFDSKKAIKSNRGSKYLQIIKPLFKLHRNCESTENLSVGNGILKKVKSKVDYVYWDDPNELVERLKLLIASREAGNTGLDSEITSIIEELHENKII